MSRFRSESGMTLIEVLAAATVGFVVLAAAFGLLEGTLRLNTGVIAKTDAMQRGRLALDTLTQQLRSQVCLDWRTPAVVEGGTASSVEFYADYSNADGTRPPVKRRLTFDAASGDIRSYITTTTVLAPMPASYPSTPSSANLVLENAALQRDPAGQPVPFLRYYEYSNLSGRPVADKLLPPPLDADEVKRVARIEVAYAARPTGARDDTKAVYLADEVGVRHADPNAIPDPTNVNWVPSPECI